MQILMTVIDLILCTILLLIQIYILECGTGEVRVTQGYSLPARYIIHTVGPKYNIKCQSAAENTLHSCYR